MDSELVERVWRGDPHAFDRLVRRHLRAAHSVARARLNGSHMDADDVVQDAFIAALERIEECRRPERFRSWLLTIVRNRAHNHRRYEAIRATEPLESVGAMAEPNDPGARLAEGEIEKELERAMEGLSAVQREVFTLFALEGWSHGEIARKLDISVGTSRYHLHVARKAVRERLTTLPLEWNRP